MRDFYFPKGGLSMKPLQYSVGISDFSEIRKNGYYYVDKSFLIRELLKISGTQVTLITRPRRFGKTLGMSMLASFFDIRKDSNGILSGFRDFYLYRPLPHLAEPVPNDFYFIPPCGWTDLFRSLLYAVYCDQRALSGTQLSSGQPRFQCI